MGAPAQAAADAGSVARQAHAYIRARVTSGAFAPGSRLTEEQLARELGVSRTPVREAMRMLVADGVLIFKPNVGTFVGAWNPEDVAQLFDLRLMLEGEVTALAAARFGSAGIEALGAIQDALESRGCDQSPANLERIARLNREFHRIVAEASAKPRLVAMLANAIEMPIVQQTFRRYTPAQLARSFAHHRELIDAFRARDSQWARSVISCHILAARHACLDGAAGPAAEPKPTTRKPT
ncbi:MAG: GntR family transcriptional regulator [Burkholderiales bacterium]|nr:GntR family transcriptional regulator [Burkholderiales bacterium]